ncbi:hypothetical protein BN159_7739 [Streptomyces davaonensis JCM 4913]|uniref:Uncharacterized protein n=1 Tax=Streptomyces davaonensis (strain DSM 101723 / JCM 4913 / KCC S-0913 / 768) TaxID=1214101 RepID=K4REA6_STRDJ|nr:hypothetical protein [Streptomyces davaonensis]CCK32118.1 hypothetical protein BN159_7739 [Streptomyces davaonensis JCM 4913]
MTASPPPAQLQRFTQRLPLVSRRHLVYPSFATRVEEVHTCAEKSAQEGPLLDRINLACATWNLSALIASDCGMTDLATDLCLRQLCLFQAAWPVTGDTAIAALQPIVNLVRLTARAGDPHAAYQQLMSVHRAVHNGGTVSVHGHLLDLTGFTTHATLDHIQPWLNALLLEDGTRFLVATGQWAQAAEHAAAYDKAAERLHDSRQARVMASVHTADPNAANSLIETAMITEPWEKAVAQLLRRYADYMTGRATPEGFTAVTRAVQSALAPAPPHLRMFRVKLVLAAIDLASQGCEAEVQVLHNAIVSDTVQASDAYAAREILRHPVPSASGRSRHELEEIVHAGGLGRGTLSKSVQSTLMRAVHTAGASLTQCLTAKGGVSPDAIRPGVP